jgi:hypothetical protein
LTTQVDADKENIYNNDVSYSINDKDIVNNSEKNNVKEI